MSESLGKFICGECDHRGQIEDMLKAESPFEAGEEMYACPGCKSVGQMHSVCDEPGCWREVSCGTPTDNGYRSTCHDHAPAAPESEGGKGGAG